MLKYTAKKMLALIPKLLIISLIIFFALECLPGDPLTRSVSPDVYGKMTEAQKDAYRESMGLNDPAILRYFSWLGGILTGDFGYSTSTGANIGTMLATRMPYTIELAFWGLMIATVIGLLLGFLASIKKNTIIDYLCTTVSVVGISVPDFFWGIVIMLIFALKLKLFPTGGRMPVGDDSFLARVPYMVLPACTMAVSLLAALTRSTRGAMLDVLNKDYIKTARSKGLSEGVVNFKHGFRNALSSVMTILCMRIPMLVGGSVVIETVFNYPAVGTMAIDALNAGDIPVVMMTTMAVAVMVLIASTLVDIMTAILDPRVRFE